MDGRLSETQAGGSLIAALYVQSDGAYAGLPGVELWDEARDARRYAGPWPVVGEYPPCAALGPLPAWQHTQAASVHQGRRWRLLRRGPGIGAALGRCTGASGLQPCVAELGTAVAAFDGWLAERTSGEAGVAVSSRGHYGHASRKASWLYAVGCDLPELKWGSSGQRLDPLMLERHGYEKARRVGVMAVAGGKRKTEIRNATPPAFRDLLLSIAASAQPRAVAA